MTETTPNPGSDAAIEAGCECPVLDNNRGAGPGPFWISELCPLLTKTTPKLTYNVGDEDEQLQFCNYCQNSGEVICHCGGDQCYCGAEYVPCVHCEIGLEAI